MALWVIGYGIIQSFTPKIIGGRESVQSAQYWSGILALTALAIAVCGQCDVAPEWTILGGLVIFGMVFAVNSALHSYLILAYSNRSEVAIDVGFYYSANAAGRLTGTLLSGLGYMWGGITVCLWTSTSFLVLSWIASLTLPRIETTQNP